MKEQEIFCSLQSNNYGEESKAKDFILSHWSIYRHFMWLILSFTVQIKHFGLLWRYPDLHRENVFIYCWHTEYVTCFPSALHLTVTA